MLDFGAGSFFLTPAQLEDSPSARHGVPAELEKMLRIYGCEIIQEAAILLRMPQAVPATAQVLLHRFFCKQSFRDFDVRVSAASCFWLSMKLEEEEGASGRRGKMSLLDDVVAMFEHIRYKRERDPPLARHSPAFKMRKEQILKQETRILAELGFVCHVEHPHKLLLGYLNCLCATKELVQEAWNLVNDSLRTTLCVSYSSNVIACGVVYAAARRLSVPLPDSPPWWLSFDVTNDDILSVCLVLADLYRQPKSRYVNVKRCLETLKKSPCPDLALKSVLFDNDLMMLGPQDGGKKDVSNILPSDESKVLNPSLMTDSGIVLSKGVLVNASGDLQQQMQVASVPNTMDVKISRDGVAIPSQQTSPSLSRCETSEKNTPDKVVDSMDFDKKCYEPKSDMDDGKAVQSSRESSKERPKESLKERSRESSKERPRERSRDRDGNSLEHRERREYHRERSPVSGPNDRRDRDYHRGSRKRDSREIESYNRDFDRSSEHRYKRREDHHSSSYHRVEKYSSRYYDDRKYDNRHYYCERVKG